MNKPVEMAGVRLRLQEIANRDTAVSVTVRAEDLRAILEQPAEQHQGEPVALPERKDPAQHWVEPGGVHKAEGWNACLDKIAKLGPLYTHADPNVRWKAVADEQMQVIAGLREQLAAWQGLAAERLEMITERDALLRHIRDTTAGPAHRKQIDAALSASAEPSAPKYPRVEFVRAHKHTCANVQPGSTSVDVCDCGAVVDGLPVPAERDERAAFEAFFEEKAKTLPLLRGATTIRYAGGQYVNDWALFGNIVWKARAALEHKK